LLCFADVREGVLGQGEVVPNVAFHGATHGQEVLAFHVCWEQADAELVGERQDAILDRSDPLAAHFDHGAALERVVEDAATDAVAGL
jgi:hypothetical protein